MDLAYFVSLKTLRNWHSTSVFFPAHDTNGKGIPISMAPHPSYERQLWTNLQAHLVNGFGIIYLTESLQAQAFHLPIYPPNGESINKWETNANLNGPTSLLCLPTL